MPKYDMLTGTVIGYTVMITRVTYGSNIWNNISRLTQKQPPPWHQQLHFALAVTCIHRLRYRYGTLLSLLELTFSSTILADLSSHIHSHSVIPDTWLPTGSWLSVLGEETEDGASRSRQKPRAQRMARPPLWLPSSSCWAGTSSAVCECIKIKVADFFKIWKNKEWPLWSAY